MTEVNGLTKDPRMNDVRSLLTSMKAQFEMALPRHLSADRMIRVALTACQRNPKLLDCTPRSFAAAMMTAAQVGLEPDGTLGRAYMIPRKNNKAGGYLEANFQFGYQGLLELCHRSGEIASVRADVVRKGDALVYSKGLDEKLEHREGTDNFDAEITHVYGIIRTKSGGTYWDVWPAAKVEAHRRRFSKDGRDDSVWATDWASMAKKTLLLAVLKYAPKSVEVAAAVAADEQGELGLPANIDLVDVIPVGPPKTIAQLTEREKAAAPASEAELPPQSATGQPEPSAIPPRRRKKPEAPVVAADAPVEENPFLFGPPPPIAAQAKQDGAAYMMGKLKIMQEMLGEGMFGAIAKKHAADAGMLNYGLGSDGLKALLAECERAITG